MRSFNGIDILVQRIDEIIQSRQSDERNGMADILESSIATLRILTKGLFVICRSPITFGNTLFSKTNSYNAL